MTSSLQNDIDWTLEQLNTRIPHTQNWVPQSTGTWTTIFGQDFTGHSLTTFLAKTTSPFGNLIKTITGFKPDVLGGLLGKPVAGGSDFTLSGTTLATAGTGGGAGIVSTVAAVSAGLKINLIWDTSVALAPAGFVAAVQNAANILMATFSDAVTLNFSVGWGTIAGQPVTQSGTALGGPSTGDYITTAALQAALTAHATSSADQAAVASIGAQNPNGNGAVAVWRAQEKALGIITANDSVIDGYIGFSTDFPSYDWTAGALHELAHAMGRTSGYASYGILDLMRYSAPGVHAYAGGGAQYFSLDGGKTDLANFAPTSDYGDFASDALTVNDPFNAYVSSNSNALTQIDLIELDAIGFTRAGSVVTPPSVLADLTIASATLLAPAVKAGASLQLSYKLADTGGNAGASSAQVLIDGKVVTSNAFAALSAGTSASVTDTLSTVGLVIGHHTLTVRADATNAVTESNEANNTVSLGFDILAISPDLVVSSAITSVASVRHGTILGLSYRIADIGTGAAAASRAGIYIDGQLTPAVQTLVSAINAGASAAYAVNISTAALGVGMHTLTVRADITNLVAESNETNNALSTSFRVT